MKTHTEVYIHVEIMFGNKICDVICHLDIEQMYVRYMMYEYNFEGTYVSSSTQSINCT
jgi:hypothetical protein